VLTYLKVLQAPYEPRPKQQADQQSRQTGSRRPKGHVLDDIECLQGRPVSPKGKEEFEKQMVEHYASTLEKL
jgi:hypothetical protein